MNETPEADLQDEAELPAQDARDAEIAALSARVEKLEAEIEAAEDRALRIQAEAQNIRRRAAEEAKKVRETAAEKLVVDLLPVLDNLERTVGFLDEGVSPETLRGGVGAVERQFRNALEGVGVKRVTSLGEPFDAEVHDALGTDVTAEFPADHVSFEFESAYRMGDRVIRHARVKVAKPA